MEVADRLPFEVVERIAPGGPTLREDWHLQQPFLVMATKGAGTVRPFVRLPVVDLLLYQALVDRTAETIEATLRPRDQIFAYRQAVDITEPNPFEGSPVWSDFNAEVKRRLEADQDAFSVKADISGYFIQIDPIELERSLLERGAPGVIARDLGELLRGWQTLGIRGVPQGLPPSSALGNFYLAPVDDYLAENGIDFVRYVDDIWLFTDTFSDARRAQDLLERKLYEMGLSLSGEKSTIARRGTALTKLRTAEEILQEHQELFREGWEAMLAQDYADPDELPAEHEVDIAAVLDLYSQVLAELRAGEYPEGFRPLLRNVYRELRAAANPDAIGDVVELLTRFPDLTHDAILYVGYAASNDEDGARAAFTAVLEPGQFHREQELLEVFRAALFAPAGSLAMVAPAFGSFATTHSHPLVRARALLAWGAHSAPDDFRVADEFWADCSRAWRIYPFVAIQDKETLARDERYKLWSAEGRVLQTLGDSIVASRFSWRRI